MNADERRFKHEDLTRRIIQGYFDVYNELGYGFLEAVYQEAMVITLRGAGLRVDREFGLEAHFRGVTIGVFKADLVVNDRVLVELKAARQIAPSHVSQVLNYLRCGVLEVALLFNFGPRPEVRRLAFSNERKRRQRDRPLSPQN